MTLPNNFPLTEQELAQIDARLAGVESYKGVGIAAPMRDLKKCRGGMQWLLNRFDNTKDKINSLQAQNAALKTYLAQVEAVVAAYASGNWDGGAAANQLLNNLPQIP